MNQLQILYLVSLLMDMSVAGVTFAISRRAAELGASASELGWLGAVWIGIYPRAPREESVRQALNIPERWRVLCLVPVGHPAETKSPRTRYEASKVYYETVGSKT